MHSDNGGRLCTGNSQNGMGYQYLDIKLNSGLSIGFRDEFPFPIGATIT